jgi:Gas vesicle synthesis protein GvpL/GvpF
MSEQREGTYVFGVVRAGTKVEALDEQREGIPEVWLAEVGDLAALVSDLPPNEEGATRDHVLAHAQVLAAAVESTTVVPMRFGMIFPSDEAIRDDLLQARHDELVQLLDRFDGRVQMTLKVDYREDAVLREILAAEPEIARLREAVGGSSEQESHDAKIKLGEMVSAAIEERRQRDSAEILEELKPVSVACVPQPAESELMVLNAPLLVEREQLDAFQEAVDEAATPRAELMHFKLLGPMPAYHFTDVEEPAWA